MLYRSIKLWKEQGKVWVAYRGHDPRDLAMGPCADPEKTIAWAKSHNLKIEDKR